MVAKSVAEIIGRHVKLTVEGIDRMYLNVYVPRPADAAGRVRFFRGPSRQPLASAALCSRRASFAAAL